MFVGRFCFILRDTEREGGLCVCRTFPPAIAVGSDEATQVAGRVQIYEYNEHNRYSQMSAFVIVIVIVLLCD